MSDTLKELTSPANVQTNARDWWLERIAWVLMLLAVAAAAAGTLGPGPLSARTARSADGRLEISYDAIARYAAPSTLKMQLAPTDDQHQLSLSRSFVDGVQIDDLQPVPLSVASRGGRMVYTFAADKSEPLSIVVRYQHQEFGSRQAVAAVPGGSEVDFSQFVFP
jgi:hypothetical protein